MKNKMLIIFSNVIILVIFYLLLEYPVSPSALTGYSIISTNESNEIIFDEFYNFSNTNSTKFKFSARFSEDIINHDSWHIGGFSQTSVFDEKDKAVFYVDVGVITPYLQVNNKRYWCKSFIKDWTKYHSFEISISNGTTFYIDEEKICEFNIKSGEVHEIFIGEKEKRGNLEMYVMDVVEFKQNYQASYFHSPSSLSNLE